MCFGAYDGVTSLGTHLVSRRHNALKLLSGIGFDLLSFLSKATSGDSAFPNFSDILYPLTFCIRAFSHHHLPPRGLGRRSRSLFFPEIRVIDGCSIG